MNKREEKTKRFSFAQLRFIIAAVLLLAAGLKAYQLATAPLPPVVQGSMFTPLLELFNNRHFQMVVVVGEILFALVLIEGLWQSWTWLLSLLGFSAFTLVSLMKGLSGEASCGCFGAVTVNPWYTATFDAAIVGLLVIFRERIDWTLRGWERRKVLAVLVAWLLLAVPTLFLMFSHKEQPHATLGTEFIGADGRKIILLDPESWIGKEFPLISRFTEPKGSEVLLQGTWSVLLVQPDCTECKQKMAELEANNIENVAIVVIPFRSNETAVRASFPVFVLDRQNDWLANTPYMIKLEKGVSVALGNQEK